MMRRAGRVLVLAALVLAASACGVTRFTPRGQYVLTSNDVRTDREVSKRERISADDVEKYIQQGPAKRFLGTNFNVWLYNSVQPDRKTWWARNMHSAGTPPVELDTAVTRISADYIGRYVRSRGYFDGSASYRLDTARRKARVTYTIKQGEPYRIGRIVYDFKDKALAPIVLPDTVNTLLKPGAPFDSGVLDAERTRIKDNLQLKGYYNFSVNNVRYLADSTVGGRKIDVTVLVNQYLTDYAEDGTPILENNPLYRIGRINIYPDYDPTRAVSDTSYMHHVDTLEYKGLNIVYGHKLRVKKEVLRELIGLHTNNVYSSQDVSRTYSNLMRLGYYRSA
ncbi:MAG: hypothetical protein LBU95_02205, partial [Rikenellaceae bacterium]|nr:hypothetical protein [Rikenellaceae bacterium]